MAGPWEKYKKSEAPAGPWSKYAAPVAETPKTEESVSKLDRLGNAALGAIQGTTLGLGDEINGAFSAVVDPLLPQGARNSTPDQGFVDRYKQGRDTSRALNDTAQKESVGEYGAGQLAGSLAIPMGEVGTLGQAVAKFGAAGAVQGFGSSSGDVATQAKDTALGGALGAAVPVAFKGASMGLSAVAPKLQAAAQNDAVKALNGTKTQNKVVDANPKAKAELGQRLLDDNIVGYGKSAKDSRDILTGVRSDEGSKLGQYYKDADAAVAVKPELAPTGQDFTDSFGPVIDKLRSDPNTLPLAKIVEKHAENIAEAYGDGPITFQQAKKFVTGLQDGAWAGNQLHPSQAKEVGRELSAAARNTLNGKLEAALGHAEVPGQNKNFSQVMKAQELAESGAASGQNAQQFGLGDKQLAHIGAEIGSSLGTAGRVAGAVVGAGANKILRTYGRGAQAAGKAQLAAGAEALARQLDNGAPLADVLKKASAIGLPREVIESLRGSNE